MPGARLPEEERREAILQGAFEVAARETIGGLSVRAVAEAAGVSKGLVFFHFKDKDTLLLALLDWILERDPRVEPPDHLEPEGTVHPARRLLTLLAHEIAMLQEREERVELLLDFWVLGTSVPVIQERIHQAFERYRKEFEPYTRAVVESLPERFRDADPGGFSSVIVSFIEGCALQFSANPEEFDVDRYMAAVEALVLGN
ncbi:MAG: TetR family transcriptional regulator C-terminal domain-containing protein [Longimicrobiales bacterium]